MVREAIVKLKVTLKVRLGVCVHVRASALHVQCRLFGMVQPYTGCYYCDQLFRAQIWYRE
jgi:hypothetical protein